MHSNVVRGLLKPWTTAAHALFSIISQTFTAERRALQWRENELSLHLQSGKWWIEIHVKKRNVWSASEEKQILLICSELKIAGTSRWNHSTDCCRIFRRGFRISFLIFFDQLITWEPDTNLDRRDSLKWKTRRKETAFFTSQSQSFSFFARPSHCCEMQTQLPQNEAPKQIRHHWTDLDAN